MESLAERIQRLAGVTPFAIVDPDALKPAGWIALSHACARAFHTFDMKPESPDC